METSNQKLDEIQSKLRKLQKLYEGAKEINSEGEAAAAAAAIQRLLTQYNLTMDEIGVEPDKDAIVQQETSGYSYRTIGGQWEQKLLSVLCKYNFCRCFIYGGSYKKLLLVGKKENIDMVLWMREVLSRKYVELSVKGWKEFKSSEKYQYERMSKDRYQRSFLMGCCYGLDTKLQNERKQDEADTEIGGKVTALVLKSNAAIDEYVKTNWGKTGHYGHSSGKYNSAQDDGYAAGKNTNIGTPISSARTAVNNVKSLGM